MSEDARLDSGTPIAAATAPSRNVAVRLGHAWMRHTDPTWLAGWTPQAFPLAGGSTEVVTMGEGPPLLLLPPLPGFKEAWVACAAGLAARFRVVTFDLRVRFAPGPRWPQLLNDLDRVAAAFAPGEVTLVGHSLGGALAQQWTLAHPERVRALVLSSSFARVHTPRGQWWSRYVAQPFVLGAQRLLPRAPALALARRWARNESWVYDKHCNDVVLDLVRECTRATPLFAGREMVGVAFAHDTRAGLETLRCPTLLLLGERESPFAVEASDELMQRIPGVERRIAPGVGHLHPLSSPEWLVSNVLEWLAAHAG